MNRSKKFIITSLLLLLSSCTTWNKLNRTEKGAVIGGGTGAVVGGAIAPGGGGALLGGALGAVGGGVIGNEQDKDRKRRY